MAQRTQIRLNDYGFTLRLTVQEDGVAVDISTITLAESIVLKPPRNTSKLRTATFTQTGVDGRVDYDVADGDFDEVGRWEVYVRVDTAPLFMRAGPFFVDVDYI